MTEEEKRENRFYIFIILVIAVEAIFFSAGNFKLEEKARLEEEQNLKWAKSLSELSLEARAVSVYDVSNGKKIYGFNDEIPLPLASLAKTMSVVLALNTPGDEIITLSRNAIKQEGDFGLYENEKWRRKDLAKLTLVSSANDGAYALSEESSSFLEELNLKARKIGMEHANFLSVTGLDLAPGKASASASALDANLMAAYGLKRYPEIFEATTLPEITLTSESGFTHKIKNTDVVIDKIPNPFFSKTGFTDTSGGNLTVIFKNKEKLIGVTVLGSTFSGRFADMEKIVNVLYNL